MANVKTQIVEVAKILAVMKDLELADLSAISRQKQQMTAQITALRRLKTSLHSSDQTTAFISASQLVGGDLRWHEWVGRKISDSNVALAGLEADFEEQKIKAQRSLSRNLAIQKISKRT